MAIAKGDSLKSTTLGDYIKSINATAYAVAPKSVHFKQKDEYLGYIPRSEKSKAVNVELTDPIVLDGKYNKDWLGKSQDLKWTEA